MKNREWNGMVIPPKAMTPCGRITDTPEKFFETACDEADRLVRDLALEDDSTILEIGCGVGRLPIGLLARQAGFASYLGIDVAKSRIDWCERELAARDRRLSFEWVNMANARYNPQGADFSLSLPPAAYDIVYLYSVFSHLNEDDLVFYLGLIAKAMKPTSRCFTTMFVADGVAPVSENPPDFGPLQWSGPLHCVLYERQHWLELLDRAGLRIVREIPEVNIDGQTGYILAPQG